MSDFDAVLAAARTRAVQQGLPYAGALLPAEAFQLLRQMPGALLVDVRTQAEWNYVGRVEGSVEIEWQTYPGGRPNPAFLQQLQQVAKHDQALLFLCRSGARSHAAAIAATEAGYPLCFNVLQGFEGDKDAAGHRNTVGGWRAAGLPWHQS